MRFIEQHPFMPRVCCRMANRLYDPESTTLVHHVTQALRAHKLFNRDQQYIVRKTAK